MTACAGHEVTACVVCMVDDFHAWLDERRERRAQLKRERQEMTVDERYDLGGEA